MFNFALVEIESAKMEKGYIKAKESIKLPQKSFTCMDIKDKTNIRQIFKCLSARHKFSLTVICPF